ncbi:DUF1700 domain-containing protein [Oxalobacteraceae bacterium A2-2]
MSKQDYLEALKKALTGLPPETVARTLADYEQRFIDGWSAGRSEEDILAGLDEPRKIAMGLRASAHLSAFEEKKTPVNLARMAVSFVGLAIFNLFMVIPAMVYAALLLTVYACAFSFYIGGIALTASGLSGQNELALEGPLRQLVAYVDEDTGDGGEWRMAIDKMGVRVSQVDPGEAPEPGSSRAGRILNRAEAVANGDLHVTTDFDSGARTSQTVVGLGLVLGGIALCLVSLVVTRYTLTGLKRYAAMNVSLLKGR